MKIRSVYFAPGFSAFYFDDQCAIKAGAAQDGFVYSSQPLTEGFDAVRQCGESVSIVIELENGLLAEGDCAAVQYSGAGGRDPLFKAANVVPLLKTVIAPLLVGRSVDSFRQNAAFFEQVQVEGASLHTAIRYGLSQALLDATAKASGRMMFQVVCDEWNLPTRTAPLALFGQSGDDRYAAVDKMILKRVDALPHGLINNIPKKLGPTGAKLAEYVSWLSHRVRMLRSDSAYNPVLHLDVYGTIGQIFENNPVRVADYLIELEQRANPFQLYVEGPVDAGSKERQIELLKTIKSVLADRKSKVRLVADEWCNTYEDVVAFVDAQCCEMVQIKTPDLGGLHNTIDAVLYAKSRGVEAYQGGTCNETDISAKACLHAALATRPDRVLVKPGMGFDEGMTIVANEMSRVLAIMSAREMSV